MKHYGDICKINGAEVERVEVVIGGSPCQDLSVAGKRAGLAGERSGLFMEQIRIIREMRERDERDGKSGVDVFPRYMVWENVPGAFSSNGGEDFRTVLEEVVRVADRSAVIPRYEGGIGTPRACSWETDGASLGAFMMRSIGESRSGAGGSASSRTSRETRPHGLYLIFSGEQPPLSRESRLSDILEEHPDPKYSLSAKACLGILRRAENRGKELHPLLEEALIRQSREP